MGCNLNKRALLHLSAKTETVKLLIYNTLSLNGNITIVYNLLKRNGKRNPAPTQRNDDDDSRNWKE